MHGDEVAGRIECSNVCNRLCASLGNLLGRDERIHGLDLHSEGGSLLANEPSDIAEGLDADSLAENLSTCGRGELVAAHVNHHCNGELGHGIGVLAGSILNDNSVGSGSGEIDIVESGTCAYYNLELRSGVKHTCRNLVRADYHRLDICNGSHEFILTCIFLKENDLIAGLFKN